MYANFLQHVLHSELNIQRIAVLISHWNVRAGALCALIDL